VAPKCVRDDEVRTFVEQRCREASVAALKHDEIRTLLSACVVKTTIGGNLLRDVVEVV